MSAERALSYADSVHQQVCDEFSSDLQSLGDLPHEVERELVEFFSDLRSAAAETRKLIAEIELLTS